MAYLDDDGEVNWMGVGPGLLIPPDEVVEVITEKRTSILVEPDHIWQAGEVDHSLVNYTWNTHYNATANMCHNGTTPLHDYDAFYLTFTSILTGIICVLGLVGNVFALIVLLKDQKKNLITVLLAALCVVDWVLLFYLLIASVVPGACLHLRDCKCVVSLLPVLPYLWPWSAFAQMVMIWIVVMASFSRYVAVCHPFRFRDFTKIKIGVRILAAILILCFLFQLPRVIVTYLSQDSGSTMTVEKLQECDILNAGQPKGEGQCYIIRSSKLSLNSYGDSHDALTLGNHNGSSSLPLDRNISYRNIYLIGLTWLAMYIVPLVMLVYMNVRLSLVLQKAMKVRMLMSNQKSDVQDHSMTINIIAIITVFLVCQTPDFIAVIITNYPSLGVSTQIKRDFIAVSIFLQACNSAIDFLLYFTFYSRFRSEAIRLLCECTEEGSWRPKPRRPSGTESSLLSRSSSSTRKKPSSQNQSQLATSDAEELSAASKLLPDQDNAQRREDTTV